MKVVRFFSPFFLAAGLLLGGCSHRKTPSIGQELSEYSPEQIEFLNREALAIASKRLEEMVIKARGSEESRNFLATDLFLKGNMSLLEGDFTTAKVLFRHLVSLVPDDNFIQKKYAISLIRDGDLEASVGVLQKLFQETKDEKIGLILAGVYTGLDKEEEARKLYGKLLSLNPRNEDACIFLGKSLAVSKKVSEALKQLSSCSNKDPSNGMYDYYAGKIYLDQGKAEKAMEFFRKAHGRQPTLGPAVSALGVLLEEQEKHDEALKVYKKYLGGNPTDTTILSRVVNLLFMKEKFSEVIPYAEKLSDFDPDNLNLKVKLGILYTDAKKYPEAISVFKDLLAAAPQSDKILYYLGIIHQEISRYEESIEYFSQIPSSSGLYSDSSIQMANILSTLAHSELAAEKKWGERFISFINKKIDEMKDMRVEFSVIKAGFYEGVGRYREAMETLMVVQDEKGFSNQHKYYLANLYEKEKKFEESTNLVMSILEKEPKNAHAWNFLGYSLLSRGEEIDRAYGYIKKAYELSPDDGYIRDSLGWYYFKKGQIGKALVELEIAFKKVPDDVEIMKHLAIVHRELKNFQRAKSFYQSALKHVRYQSDRQEILSEIAELESERMHASDKISD
jgi:tetratricopeptide (TPR) repeat protein